MEHPDNFFREYRRQQRLEHQDKTEILADSLQQEFNDFIFESEETLRRINLGFAIEDLEPVIDKRTMDLHFNVLYKNYVTKFNQTGDDFQKAGAILHQKFFENLAKPNHDGLKNIQVLAFLKKHFGTFAKFKAAFKEQALSIKGNGWIVLTKSGGIVQITNHKLVDGIVLILDMWEHAYYLTHGPDKAAYVDDFWYVVDWEIVGARI